jgi:hypothetical protein
MANTFKQISTGYSSSLALLQYNSAWAWGNVGRSADAASAVIPWVAICASCPQEIGHNRSVQPQVRLKRSFSLKFGLMRMTISM